MAIDSRIPSPSLRSVHAGAAWLALLTPMLFAPALLAPLRAQQPNATLASDRSKGAAAVDAALCSKWLHQLAGPEFAGRGTGQAGYRKAAEFVAAHFEALGLEARGKDGTFFQEVPWEGTEIERGELVFTRDGEQVLSVPASRMAGQVSGSTTIAGDALLLNVKLPEDFGTRRGGFQVEGLDDLELDGKFVIAVVHAEGRRAAFARFAVARALRGREGGGLVFANRSDVTVGLTGRNAMARSGGNPAAAARRNRPLDVSIGKQDLGKLAEQAGLQFDALAEAPLSVPLQLHAKLTIEAKTVPAPAMNVFAVLPGSDEKLKDEYVVIGSHLDHLGIDDEGVVHPGADDDGSGTTGVMAVAQMFARNGARPRRSVLFVCFSGEERGLLGSRYFARNCPIPLESIAAELQMDMIGRSEEETRNGRQTINVGETAEDNANCLHVVGSQRFAPSLHEICVARNEVAGFDIELDHEDMFLRSDHANFAFEGVPVAFFFTGLHDDYHRPSDTPDKIDYPKLLRVSRYVYDIAYELADAEQRPLIEPELWQKFRDELIEQSRRRRRPMQIREKPVAPMREKEK